MADDSISLIEQCVAVVQYGPREFQKFGGGLELVQGLPQKVNGWRFFDKRYSVFDREINIAGARGQFRSS